jgi:hypothetical protein
MFSLYFVFVSFTHFELLGTLKKYYNESLGFPAPEVQKWNFQKWLYTESLGFSTEVQKWNFQKWLYTESLGFSTEVQKW